MRERDSVWESEVEGGGKNKFLTVQLNRPILAFYDQRTCHWERGG